MPIPNTDYTTAIVIPSIPFNLTTTANDAGVTHDLWYKFTAPATEILSVYAFGNTTGYAPLMMVYQEVAGFPEDLPNDLYNPSGQNTPVSFPVEIGVNYFIEINHTSSSFVTPADVTIDIIRHVPQDYPNESLMIPDDTWGFPGAILSPVTGEVLKFIHNFPAGEEGDSLDVSEGGQILTEDYINDSIKLYDKQLNFIVDIPTPYSPRPSSNIGDIKAQHSSSPKFYLGFSGLGLNPAFFRTVSLTGVLGTIYVLPNAGLTAIAVNQAETIAYITGQSNSAGTYILRWDLINNVQLSNFTVTPVGTLQVFILKNDNIVVISYNSTTRVTTISEYDSSHNLLHSYTFPNLVNVRIKHATDNPLSIWCWFTVYPFNGMSRFIKLRLSDGVYLKDFSAVQFESGEYQGNDTLPATARFGHSFSCPMTILYEGGTAGGGGPEPTPPDLGGIYFINPAKSHETYYTAEKKIPNPTIKTALIGE